MKERLVGAAVLTAAAVILIQEMLSGPRRAPAPAAPPVAMGESSLKRYSIDLEPSSRPAESPATPTVIEDPVPSPEDGVADTESSSVVTTPGAEREDPPSQAGSERSTPMDVGLPAQAAQAVPHPESVDSPVAAAAEPQAPAAVAVPAPATGRWAVQLIAYDKREQAQRMAEDLRSSNIAAFVMPVQTKTGLLYRVRVGPFTARAEAEDALPKLKAVSSGATVVAQP